jgi:hypothetical protein
MTSEFFGVVLPLVQQRLSQQLPDENLAGMIVDVGCCGLQCLAVCVRLPVVFDPFSAALSTTGVHHG